MIKKVIIGLVLLIILFLFIFKSEVILNPSGFFGSLECAFIIEKCGVFWGNIISYILVCDGLLFWVGISAGWTWARDNCFGFGMRVFCAFIGIFLSFPIAIVKLFSPQN